MEHLTLEQMTRFAKTDASDLGSAQSSALAREVISHITGCAECAEKLRRCLYEYEKEEEGEAVLSEGAVFSDYELSAEDIEKEAEELFSAGGVFSESRN